MSTLDLPTPALSPLIASIEAIALANPDFDATNPSWPQALHDAIQARGHSHYTINWLVVHDHLQEVSLELDPGYNDPTAIRLDIPFSVLDAPNVTQAALIHQVEQKIHDANAHLIALQRSILSVQDTIQKAHAELVALKADPAS